MKAEKWGCMGEVRGTGQVRVKRFGTWQKGVPAIVGIIGLWVGMGEVAHAQSARAQAPFDPTGQWVSLLTRDWVYRMIVPGRGEYQGIPLSLAGKQFADAWDASQYEATGRQCAPYGGAVVMLLPTRLRINWQDEQTLQVQTDAGMQTRLLHFQAPDLPAGQPRSWQGYSSATWIRPGGAPPPAGQSGFGTLKIATTNLLAGLIRKNGVAYSDQTSLTERWELHADPATQTPYLIVTGVLRDPVYLTREYYYTATFQREEDGSKWDPTPCSLTSTP